MITTTALTRSRLLIAVVLLTLGTAGLSTTATAATSPDTTPETASPTSTLSAKQHAKLDRRVERVLDRTDGGERTAANEITWAEDGVVLTLPVPGAGAEMQTNAQACKYTFACLYAARHYQGKKVSFTRCGFRQLDKYDFRNITSSWVNNQTPGTRSTLYYVDAYKRLRTLSTGTAFDAESFPHGSWKDNRADYLRVC